MKVVLYQAASAKARWSVRPVVKGIKLNSTQVACIKKVWRAGGISRVDLARRFGISYVMLEKILLGRAWGWVE